MYMHVIWVWPMSHFVTFYVKVNFCTNIYHNLNCCFPFVVVELYRWTERFCQLIISIWSLILCFEKGVGWRGCGNKDSHANSPAKLKLMLTFKRKIIHGISLKVMLFYNISRENIFSKYTRVAMSDSSRIFFVPLLYFVRRHRHKPQPPPLCCQLLPGQQSTAKWCHWTLCRHPRLPRAANSRRWGWTWTSARTCCRCTENPWRRRSQPGIAARKVEKEKENWVINKVRCNKTNDKVKYAIK